MREKLEKISIFIAILCLISAFVYAEIISPNNEVRNSNVEIYKAGRRYRPGQEEGFSNLEESESATKKEDFLNVENNLNQKDIKKMNEILIPLLQGNYYKGIPDNLNIDKILSPESQNNE